MEKLFNVSDISIIMGPFDVLLAAGLSLFLSLMLAEVYKITHRSTTYSQQTLVTMIVMSMTVSVIMLIIGSNIARAFSLVGALSIVRFRNPVKDPKDIAYLFISMAIGMGCGTNFYLPIVVFTIFVSIVLLVLHYTNYGSRFTVSQLLKVETQGDFSQANIEQDLKSYFKSISLINQSILDSSNGSSMMVYLVTPTNNKVGDSLEEVSSHVRKSNPAVTRLTLSSVQNYSSV